MSKSKLIVLGLILVGSAVLAFDVIYSSILLAGAPPTKENTAGSGLLLAVAFLSIPLLIIHLMIINSRGERRHSKSALYVLLFLWVTAVIVTVATFGASYARRQDWEVLDMDEINEITAELNSRDLAGAAASLLIPRKSSSSSGGGRSSSSSSRGSRVSYVGSRGGKTGPIRKIPSLVALARNPLAPLGLVLGSIFMLAIVTGLFAVNLHTLHKEEAPEHSKEDAGTIASSRRDSAAVV